MSNLELAAVLEFAVIILLLGFYCIWNLRIKHRPLLLTPDRDEEAVKSGTIQFVEVRKIASPWLSVTGSLTGITFSGTLVVIALSLSAIGVAEFNVFRKVVLYVGLGLMAGAAICWMFALEQLTIMAASSTQQDRWFSFYRSVGNLWTVGGFLITFASLLFLLLASPIVAIVVQTLTGVIAVTHWNIHYNWSLPFLKPPNPEPEVFSDTEP